MGGVEGGDGVIVSGGVSGGGWLFCFLFLLLFLFLLFLLLLLFGSKGEF